MRGGRGGALRDGGAALRSLCLNFFFFAMVIVLSCGKRGKAGGTVAAAGEATDHDRRLLVAVRARAADPRGQPRRVLEQRSERCEQLDAIDAELDLDRAEDRAERDQ